MLWSNRLNKKSDSEWSGKSTSPKTNEEDQLEQDGGSEEGQSTPFWVKRYREQEKKGPWKETKEAKPSLNLITLTDGDIDEIRDQVRDTNAELMQ